MTLAPSLQTLPSPPPGKSGWPWTVDIPEQQSAENWPKITVVTPSFNQGKFLEETIRSILLQGYPNLEWFVIDGGSIDQSLEIIRKYQDFMSYWVSEADRGQSDALNKGFARGSGEIFTWLNSDDVWQPNTLFRMAETYQAGYEFASAHTLFIDEQGKVLRKSVNWQRENTFLELMMTWKADVAPPQPAMFFSKRLFCKVGPLVENLHYTMDYDLWIKISHYQELKFVDEIWAKSRLHQESKGVKHGNCFAAEGDRLVRDALAQASWKIRLHYWWKKYTAKGYLARYLPSWLVHFVRRVKGKGQ